MFICLPSFAPGTEQQDFHGFVGGAADRLPIHLPTAHSPRAATGIISTAYM